MLHKCKLNKLKQINETQMSTNLKMSGFCHFGLVLFMVLWQSPDTSVMSGFHVSAWLWVCSSRVLSCLHALFRVGAWCSDPGTHVLSFGFVTEVWTLTLHILSFCASVRSCVRSAAHSSVHVCCVLCCCTQFMFYQLSAFMLCLVLCGTQLVYFFGCVLLCCHVLCEHVAYGYSH